VNVPARGIGGATVEKLRLGQGDKISPAIRKKVDVFLSLLDRIADKAKSSTASDTMRFVLKETGLGDMFKESGSEDVERTENLMELVTVAARYDELQPGESIEVFLGDAALAAEEEATDAEGKKQAAVRLMTVHAAKGLEFDYVFITGLEQDLFPHSRRGNESNAKAREDSAEEERRLFYVALTRARVKLFLTYAQFRTIFGQQETHTPSEFLYDIPEEHTEKEIYVSRNSFNRFSDTYFESDDRSIEF
jgi:DNA helicase-2/ATP-dependent DNA helicase PcrA